MALEQRITLNHHDFRSLSEGLDGTLLRPGDEGYDEARVVHNAAYQRTPRFILQAASARDVVRGVTIACERGLTPAVRSGGHSMAGHSTSDGLVIDLRGMREIVVDPDARIARVEPGLNWGEVSVELQAYGLAVPSGDTASVGVGGLTTGGGIGWLVRKYGLTVDSLLSVEMVTADGRLVRAGADENPELFWGVRGGGGNFGIVTSFEFQAHPVGTVIAGAVVYDAAEARDVLSGWSRYASEAPEELSTIVFVMHAPPLPFIPLEVQGRRVIVIGVCCVGDVEASQQTVEPLRRLGEVVADVTGPAPYPAVYALTEGIPLHGLHVDMRSAFLRQIGGEEIEAILRQIDTMRPPMDLLQIRILGGAMARVPKDATAFPHRDKEIMASAISLWADPDETALRRGWLESFRQRVAPYADGVYVNFLGDEGPGRVLDAYGPETLGRLAMLKRRYDPSNVFRLNQNIEPT